MSSRNPEPVAPAVDVSPPEGNAAQCVAVQSPFSLKAVAEEHILLLVLLGAYFISVACLLLITGHMGSWVIRWGYPLQAGLFVAGSLPWLFASRSAREPNRVIGAVAIASLAAPFQSTFNSVKQLIDDLSGYTWDARLAEADRWIHFGHHPWEWLAPLVRHPGVILFLDLGYTLWFPVIFGFLIWAAWTADRTLRRRALASTVLVWVLCGNAAAIALSSAGPCYYDAVVSGINPYRPLMEALETHHERGFLFARFNQTAIWDAMRSDTWLPFGGVSAMPSVHVAMAVLMALVARERNRTAGLLVTVFALITMIGSVVLAWHYAIDGYVGAVMAYAVWRGVRRYVPDVHNHEWPSDVNRRCVSTS